MALQARGAAGAASRRLGRFNFRKKNSYYKAHLLYTISEMAFSSHYVFLHYITLHYIYVTLHHVTSHYIYLYVFIFNLGAISFFHTKLIVQAYGQLGHRVQDSASTLDSLTSSEVDKVIAQLAIGHCHRRDSAPRQVSQTGQSNWFHQFALD